MAVLRDITTTDAVFNGEDKSLIFTIYQADNVVPQDVLGWTISWLLKRNKLDPDASAKLTKTTSNGGVTIGGAYNVNPATNLQRVTVSLTDDDTTLLLSTVTYYHELKRTDAGVETVLSYGSFAVRQAVHR